MDKIVNKELVPLLPVETVDVVCSDCGLTVKLSDIVSGREWFYKPGGRVWFARKTINADQRLELDRMRLLCKCCEEKRLERLG